MKNPLALTLALLLLGGAAHASAGASKLHLLDQSEGQLDPVAHAKTDLFLLGLGLVGGGLVLGGAGFIYLYFCNQRAASGSCQPPDLYIGYGLAAPGLLPLAAGLIIIYLFTGGRHGSTMVDSVKPSWALALVPLGGGGMIGASGTF